MRRSNKFSWMLLAVPSATLAHSFYERYDLPIPLAYFLWGSAAVVALTFVMMLLLPSKVLSFLRTRESMPRNPTPLVFTAWMTKVIALVLFVLTVAAALFGTANPLMNLAPTLVWVTWWVGFALLVACVGNVWPWLDPLRTLHDGFNKLLGAPAKYLAWPKRLALWPAVLLMLLWGWLEVVYPIALVPFNLGCVLVVWAVVSLLGMRLYGAEVWQSSVDFFAIYFKVIAKMGSEARHEKSMAYVGFIMAMLSTVLFDGLHGNPIWNVFEEVLSKVAFGNDYVAGTLGLLGVWLVFMLSFYACTREYASQFAPSLIPIAVAYLVAHNFSNLVVQGQNVVYLLSDPFGWGWNLLGTKDFKPDSDWLDAMFSWYLAVIAIVIGHALAVLVAHRAAVSIAPSRWQIAKLTLPLTLLMIAYTVLSLLIIAEPIVHVG